MGQKVSFLSTLVQWVLFFRIFRIWAWIIFVKWDPLKFQAMWNTGRPIYLYFRWWQAYSGTSVYFELDLGRMKNNLSKIWHEAQIQEARILSWNGSKTKMYTLIHRNNIFNEMLLNLLISTILSISNS